MARSRFPDHSEARNSRCLVSSNVIPAASSSPEFFSTFGHLFHCVTVPFFTSKFHPCTLQKSLQDERFDFGRYLEPFKY